MIALVLIAGLFGLVVGSFLNVVIHRVPKRESIVWPSSHCPKCGAAISPKDNLPIVSYVLLRGKCRNCSERISPRYPLVEALTGLLFAGVVWEFAADLQVLRIVSGLVFVGVLVALAGTDIEYRLLPNWIVGPAAVVGLVLSVLVDPERWWVYVVSMVAVAGALFALVLAYPRGMGMGDVKMAGMLGAFLGPYAGLAVFLGAFVGMVVSLALMAVGVMGRRAAIPFGAFLAIGGVVTLFVGRDLWNVYIDFVGGV